MATRLANRRNHAARISAKQGIASSQNEAAANGNINTIAGTGTPGYNGNGLAALSTNLDGLDGLVVTSKGVFVADTAQNRVRKIH